MDALTAADFTAAIDKQFDLKYTPDYFALAKCATAVLAHKPENDLFEAAQHKCEWCWHDLTAVLTLVATECHLAAFGHTRSLYENLLTTLHLSKHPEKLADFKDYGKVASYEIFRDLLGSDKDFFEEVREEYAKLRPRFVHRGNLGNWHRTSVFSLFEEAGMEKLYHTYYKQASSFAHGDAQVGTTWRDGKWSFDIANLDPTPYGRLAVVTGHFFFVDFLGAFIDIHKLPYKEKWHPVYDLAKERMEAG